MRDYLKMIGSIPLLSAEQEQNLAVRAANGDQEAIDMLVTSNLRLVVSIAKRYVGFGIQLWMYATPIVYPYSEFSGAFRVALMLNPMTPVVEAWRRGDVPMEEYAAGTAGPVTSRY